MMNDSEKSLKITKESDHAFSLYYGNTLLTTLNINNSAVSYRPYFYPMNTLNNTRVTRGYPAEKISGETEDHVHHTSVWSAWGDMNGVDCWSHADKSGKQIVKDISYEATGNSAKFTLLINWASATDVPLLFETRTIKITTDKNAIIYDFALEFDARYGRVRFGDTKEGGLLSVRVPTSMDVPQGQIINSNGKKCTRKSEERQVWGKRAEWCCYAGKVDGKSAGIAIIDHPNNPIYPTYWHVRSYGLMTANPFGKSHFVFPLFKGTWILEDKKVAIWRYRLVVFDQEPDINFLNKLNSDFKSAM